MKFMNLAVPLMILFMAVSYIAMADYQKDTWENLQERHLDIAMNYAVDAAVERMTEDSSDLALDYQYFESMNVDPQVALDMYRIILCKNLGYNISDNNIDYIDECTALFVVAGYDGYYLAREREVDDLEIGGKSYKLVWNPKMPYYCKKTVNGVDYLYALNLGLEDALRWYSDGTNSSCDRVFTSGLLTENEQKQIISSCISDDMMAALWDVRGSSSRGVSKTLLIPSDMSTWTGTNPISSTTVLAYVEGLNLGPVVSYSSFGIGGSRVVHEEFVLCYNKDGKNLYTYADSVPAGVKIIESFTNSRLAAESGYYFDMNYFE